MLVGERRPNLPLAENVARFLARGLGRGLRRERPPLNLLRPPGQRVQKQIPVQEVREIVHAASELEDRIPLRSGLRPARDRSPQLMAQHTVHGELAHPSPLISETRRLYLRIGRGVEQRNPVLGRILGGRLLAAEPVLGSVLDVDHPSR